MSNYEIKLLGPITLPGGLSVGDEFRVAGRCRVTAIAEDHVDISQFGQKPGSQFAPGERTITLGIGDITMTGRD